MNRKIFVNGVWADAPGSYRINADGLCYWAIFAPGERHTYTSFRLARSER